MGMTVHLAEGTAHGKIPEVGLCLGVQDSERQVGSGVR